MFLTGETVARRLRAIKLLHSPILLGLDGKNIMGGGSKRKANDSVRINVPKVRGDGTGGGGGAGGSSTSGGQDVNRQCPLAFDVLIRSKNKLPDGTPVTVRGGELFVLGELVGKLTEAHKETLATCGKLGIRYTPAVVNTKTRAYARFEQNE